MLQAKSRAKRARRGVTLVEVLIVVAIMAVIAGGATLLVFPAFKKSRVEAAKVGAESVRQAAELYQAEADAGECPQVKELADAKKLDSKKTDDPWGKPYKVVCDEGDIHAFSFGADGQEGTPDDVRDDTSKTEIKKIAEM
ncbi:MAG: type II secretion system protein [Polyangiaceae bacterium]|nr:type II secretion system protein [Polyangiaceae bacterium]